MDEPAIKQLIANELHNAVQSSQNSMLSRIDNLMSNKLGTFESSMKESLRQLSDSQIAKIEELTTDNYEFKRKGNKEQHEINIKIIKKMKEAKSNLHDSPMRNDQIDSATQRIGEGIDLLTHRQTFVKMADQSESGWKMVEEYQTNSLADNSEDEKRIRRADVRDAQKMKAERKTKKSRLTPISHPTSTRSSAPIPIQTSLPVHRPGKCYECGKPGHWRKDHAAMMQNFDKISIDFEYLSDCQDFEEFGISDSENITYDFLNKCSFLNENNISKSKQVDTRSLIGMLKRAFNHWTKSGANDQENVEFLNGKELLDEQICTSVVYTDAPGTGFGWYIVDYEESEVIGSWKPEEQVKSSTWRELKAVYRMLMSKLTYLKGQKVLWRTDNQKVVHILYKGSVKSDLQIIAINIADICTREEIQLSPQWIPRTDNVKADLFSENQIVMTGRSKNIFSTILTKSGVDIQLTGLRQITIKNAYVLIQNIGAQVPKIAQHLSTEINISSIIKKHKDHFGVDCTWDYFEAGHEKGPCDGLGGTVKRCADLAIKQRKCTIQCG
ncbi:unnamed protein product [Mytilus coruscus]|uniref:CCHC-type domain-containing protein n=1 Tax=Mytilus coruscus TaxID=42192 RepID=A0A6J8AD05_MYTCO|nr:unnamed protein product [Mytilus coruscus]